MAFVDDRVGVIVERRKVLSFLFDLKGFETEEPGGLSPVQLSLVQSLSRV